MDGCGMRARFAVLLIMLIVISLVLAAFPFGKAQDSSSAIFVLSPLSVTMNVGESVPFIVTFPQSLKGTAIFHWYVNGTQVVGENDPSWAFTPTAAGNYSITVDAWTSSAAYNETTNNSTSHFSPNGMSATAQVSVTTSSPTGSFGYPYSSSQTGGHGAQFWAVGSRFLLKVEANVTSISCLMDGFYGNFIYSFAIYNDENGLLANLVAQSTQGFINYSDRWVTTWHTLPFASPVNLSPGAYWLMEIDNGSDNHYMMISSNPNVNDTATVEAGTGGLTLPTRLDSPIYTQNYTMCIFASYTTGTPISSPTPNPTPSPTTLPATTDNGAMVNLTISGNITDSQMSNVTISANQSATVTTVSFNVTGEGGTTGFGNITIPKSEIPNTTTPTIYIDGQAASNQGFTQDTDNYYVWFTTHFSTHQISIVFAPASSSGTAAQSSLLQVVYGVAIAVTVVATVVVVLRVVIKGKKSKFTSNHFTFNFSAKSFIFTNLPCLRASSISATNSGLS
jgi:hypothetical protein